MKLLEIVNMVDIKEHQQVLFISFLIRKQDCQVLSNQLKNYINQLLKKSKRRQVYTRFKDNICSGDLAKFESLSSKNRNVKYLLYVIDVVTKYVWVKLLKDKKGKTDLNPFIEIVNESNRKLNKI